MKIQILPNQVTYPAVAELRVLAESQADPQLYELVAKGFDALNMPASAARMRDRRNHYLFVHWIEGKQNDKKKTKRPADV